MKDLKQYVGSKLITAKPMNRADYNTLRGWDLPEDEDGTDEGYLVQYEPSEASPPNVEGLVGYVSWSPKTVFEEAYQDSKEGLPFSLVLDQVKNHGARAARKGWNGKGMFIFLVPGSTFIGTVSLCCRSLAKAREVKYHGHIDMKTADGMIVPWLASQTDILANDWSFV